RGRLYIEPARAAAPAPIAWNGQRELAWAGGWLSFAPATGEGVGARALEGAAVEVRARAGGERLRP
ncbi:MAG TPA: tRNA(Ile)-lysidine synthetase, partial [Rhodocyclaceae bacterium]|nr:tRNA(Ile)-lysidine synthetase [Rhodocyclaceae bacterium]